jgi:hypothetical protein
MGVVAVQRVASAESVGALIITIVVETAAGLV